MQTRWASGFTIVEMIIVIVTIAILTTVTIIGFGKVRYNTLSSAAQSDLRGASTAMDSARNHTNAYPSSLPSTFTPSNNITVALKQSGSQPYYSSLTAVQDGVLFSKICSDLIAEGKGKGVDQGGVTRDYIQWCGNWNNNGMQVTGWDSKNWSTPVSKSAFLAYADAFTASSSWHKAQEAVVKNFYHAMVDRLEQQGGSFPITSFWDSWATPANGGVMLQPLDPSPKMRQYFCIEASAPNTDILWHVREDGTVATGGC